MLLEDKSSDELNAIQFSENSSREALHYIDKADGYPKLPKGDEEFRAKNMQGSWDF